MNILCREDGSAFSLEGWEGPFRLRPSQGQTVDALIAKGLDSFLRFRDASIDHKILSAFYRFSSSGAGEPVLACIFRRKIRAGAAKMSGNTLIFSLKTIF